MPAGGLISKVPFRAREVTECCVPLFHALGFGHLMLRPLGADSRTSSPSRVPDERHASRMSAYSVGLPKKKLPCRVLRRLAFAVVVAGSARFAPRGDDAGALHDRVDPGGFGVRGGFHFGGVVLQGPGDHPGGVAGLGVEEVREVHGEAGLGDAFDEAVREAVDVQAVQRADAVAPTCRSASARRGR